MTNMKVEPKMNVFRLRITADMNTQELFLNVHLSTGQSAINKYYLDLTFFVMESHYRDM